MAAYPRSFRILAIIVAITLVVLTACSGGASAPAAPTGAGPSGATAPPGAAAPTAPAAAPAKVTEYNIAGLIDVSSAQAVNARPLEPGRKLAIAYWNDTVGKSLGIKLNLKTYDSRYDSTVTASLWPGVLATDKPIVALSSGSPDVAALGERLPTDKVPMFLGSGGSGTVWRPGQWVFYAQPTYPHQMAGFLNWRLTNWTESRPIRLGHISSQQSPIYVDIMKGIQNFLGKGVFAGKAEDAGVEWVAIQANEVSSEIKRFVDKKTDYISAFIAAQTVVAMLRALEQYKAAGTKLVFFGASGVLVNSAATPVKDFEGAYEVSPVVSSADTANEGYKLYQQYKDKVGFGDFPWSGTLEMGLLGTFLPLRAIERAAKAVGPDKITGEAVYNAMFGATTTSKDLLGLTADLTYTKEAPFPTANLRVNISTVKDGKFQLATPDWVTVPEIPKW